MVQLRTVLRRRQPGHESEGAVELEGLRQAGRGLLLMVTDAAGRDLETLGSVLYANGRGNDTEKSGTS